MLLSIKLITALGIEHKYKIEDVDTYYHTENSIIILLNDGKERKITLRSNDGVGIDDWVLIEIKVKRVGLIPEGKEEQWQEQPSASPAL